MGRAARSHSSPGHRGAATLLLLAALADGACQPHDADAPAPSTATGSFHALSVAAEGSGVQGIAFDIAGPDMKTYAKTAPVVRGPVDATKPELSNRLYADWLLVVPAGTYHIKATPIGPNGAPLGGCTSAEADAVVVAGMTTDLTLVANCSSPQNGGLDTTVVVNSAPTITGVDTSTGKFVCLGKAFVATLTAEDKDGDPLTWSFKVVATPAGVTGTPYCLGNAAGKVSLSAAVPGEYQVQATVSDRIGTATLTFPVFVDPCGQAACPGLAAIGALGQMPNGTDGTCVCELPKVAVSADVTPSVGKVPGVTDNEEPRPVARFTTPAGSSVDFVSNELVVMTSDTGALQALLSRWNGMVVATIDPAAMGASGPRFYRVKLDLSLANPSQVPAMWARANGVVGTHLFSSDDGLRLMAAALAETGSDPAISVSINPVMHSATFASRSTIEDAVGPSGYSRNAYTWSYINRASPQDIGTGESWTFLSSLGRLVPGSVNLGVADGGFIRNIDMPAGTTVFGSEHVPNPASCTAGFSCPWHGTGVALTAAAVPDNSVGVAGPAGPVARLNLLASPAPDFFAYMQYIFGAIPAALLTGPRILNISASADLPAEACLGVLVGVPICETLNALTRTFRTAGTLIFAAAGNDGKDVDKTKTFGPCPFCVTEEETIVVPCELDGVLCVGALADNSNAKAGYSAFGSDTGSTGSVDIYGPGTVFTIADPVMASLGFSTPDTSVGVDNGTSVASPYVAGVAALIWAANPSFDANAVERTLLTTSHANSSDPMVHRWVNALGAVMTAAGRDTPPFLRIAEGDFSVLIGTTISLTALVEELQHQAVTITWSRGGTVIGTGTHLSAATGSWSLGANVITAIATDSVGNSSAPATVTVTLNPVSTPPRHVNVPVMNTGVLCPVGTQGDAEFNGGPDISLDVNLSLSSDRRSLLARIDFVATEAGGDHTQAQGHFTKTLFTADPGDTIFSIDTPASFHQMFHGPDAGFAVEIGRCDEGPETSTTFPSGLILQTRIIGDTHGTDIGSATNCDCSAKINDIIFNQISLTVGH